MGRGPHVSLAVTVLGSSGMFATRTLACSGYLLHIGQAHVWMDAGSGTWQQLLRHADYKTLTGIILTHRHPDHTTDVLQCFHARHYGGPEPLPPIPVWAPGQTIERLTAFSKESEEAFDFQTVAAGDVIDIAGARVSFHKMAHPPETVGVRVEHGDGVLAYSSDSGPEGDFDSLATGADVFICEATFQGRDGWEGHLSAAAAGKIAAEQGCRRLVLAHLPPGRDHARSLAEAKEAATGVEVLLADEALHLEVIP